MSKAPKANIARTWIVQDDIGEFTVGQKLTRMPHIIAYLMLVYADNQKEELDLSSDEIVRIINETNIEGLPPDDAEQEVIDALSAHKHGTRGDDVQPIMSVEAGIKRKSDAINLGTKLGEVFNQHLVNYLDADETIRKSCVFAADDVAGRAYDVMDPSNFKGGVWARETIEMMPVPGSKAPKGTVIDASNRDQWDYYRYTTTNGVKVSSTWYLDAVTATPEGNRLRELIDQYEAEKASEEIKSDKTARELDIEKKRLNKAAKFLRDGVTVTLALWELNRVKDKIHWMVMRDDEGGPARTNYPIRIWPKGNLGDQKPFTLSNCRKLLIRDSKGENAIDRTIANGGTMKALNEFGLPRKPRGQKKIVHISTALEAFNHMSALGTFIQSGTIDNLLKLLLDKATQEANVANLGLFMSNMIPVWERPDIQAVWNDYLVAQRKRDADRISKMHNNKLTKAS